MLSLAESSATGLVSEGLIGVSAVDMLKLSHELNLPMCQPLCAHQHRFCFHLLNFRTSPQLEKLPLLSISSSVTQTHPLVCVCSLEPSPRSVCACVRVVGALIGDDGDVSSGRCRCEVISKFTQNRCRC